MKEIRMNIGLIVRTIVFLYIPVTLVISVLFQALFGVAIRFQWVTLIIYLGVLIHWMINRYKHELHIYKVANMNELEHILMANNWEIIDRRRDGLSVRPSFDRPFNFIVNDNVEIQYLDQKVNIQGPRHYALALSKALEGDKEHKQKVRMSNLKQLAVAVFIVMPLLTESGILWEMKVLIHNVQASSADTSDTITDSQPGNLVENSHNGGYLVSNDENIFMIEYADSIVKVNRKTEEKEFIIENRQEYWFSDLNLVGEWLYFTDDDALKRIKTDGTDEQTIYDLGFLTDVQIVNGTVYFINRADNMNPYQMDLDGENLKRVLDVDATDIAVYEDYLLVSHGNEDASRVERVELDGGNREVMIEGMGINLMKWENHYYYLDRDYRLFRINSDGSSEPELVIDRAIRAYTVADQGIIYVLQDEQAIYPLAGVYITDFDGEDPTLIDQTRHAEYLVKVDDTIYYSRFGGIEYGSLNKIDLDSGGEDVLE